MVVGRIVRPHGIRGEVVVEVHSDAPDRFAAGAVLGFGDPSREVVEHVVASSRSHQKRLLVAFDGVPDRNAAEALRGVLLSVPATEAVAPGEGRYYAHQLEGMEVVDEQGAVLGVMTGVLENPANDLWIVRTPARKDVLVPAVHAFVRAVDVDARRIVLSPVPGLFD